MEQAFASWSGGKDCSLALYRATKGGLKVRYLLNMVSEDGTRSRSHGIAAKWIQMQAQAMDIPIMQRKTTDNYYEAEFVKALQVFKSEGITAGVFGDIDFNAHREWIERVCSAAGIKFHLPLWLEDQNKLLKEFIDAGFHAVVVATRADLLGEEWLGRKVDASFVAELGKLGNITPCGEAGEYHTLVINGPTFKKRLEIVKSDKVKRGEHWFLDITEARLKPKKLK